MGLLDEAIRDHLELKRRRGADPSEIARAEREALDPLVGEGPTEGDLRLEEPLEEGEADDQPWEEPPGSTELLLSAEDVEPDLATVGQETVEIDMQALLDEEARSAGGGAEPAIRARALLEEGGTAADPDRDPLDWEVPERVSAEALPEQIPGQERLSFE